MKLMNDSGNKYLEILSTIAEEDAAGLKKAQQSYGNSWKQRGGVGAFMMLCRKWDRLENQLARVPKIIEEFVHPHNGKEMVSDLIGDRYDIFAHIAADQRSEGVIDDIRDLRRYLMLVEAEMRARGFGATHRDNIEYTPGATMVQPRGKDEDYKFHEGGSVAASIIQAGLAQPE